jgi:flagellin-like hook-associated protein FlgL
MADVSLSAAVRSSLLSLQSTTDLINRTQSRLSTGLKVSSVVDDPVAFFQAKTLTDRAFDFTEKKDGIDQGVSTVTAALDGLDAVESLVRQLKGIAQSLKSATGSTFTDYVSQFNDLRSQIDLLTADATYQGTNLINGTGQTLSTEFSDISTSKLDVASVDVTSSGLSLSDVTSTSTAAGTTEFSYDAAAATTIAASATVSVSLVSQDNITVTTSNAQTFSYGTVTGITFSLTAGASSVTLTGGTTYTLKFLSSTYGSTTLSGTTFSIGLSALTGNDGSASLSAVTQTTYVEQGNSTSIDTVINSLSTALTTLRSTASSLGSNVALLQTRLDFTQTYVNTLTEGGSKLTLADINEEGANLLALQTRQQLGIQSLSFAGQAEQSVLGLFR